MSIGLSTKGGHWYLECDKAKKKLHEKMNLYHKIPQGNWEIEKSFLEDIKILIEEYIRIMNNYYE